MKRFCNYTFQMVCIYVLALAIFSIFNFDITKTNYTQEIHNINEEKILDSTLLAKKLDLEKAEKKEESIEEVNEPEKEEAIKEEYVEEKPIATPSVNILDTSGYATLATETVNISHYGHDCYGCGGQTSSGYYIGDGRTYYNDSTFGSVRIVAADYKYPEGTVVRLNYSGNSTTAIVLDRGGSVGDHGKYQIDLLASSESAALQAGVIYNASLEVLRYGY